MDGAGSRSSQYSLSNPQEIENSLAQFSSSLPFMLQGHSPSDPFSTTAPQNNLYQSTDSVSLIVTPASGTTTGTASNTTITHRIDTRLLFDVTVSGLPLQGSFIRVPYTRSVRDTVPAMGLSRCLRFSFELRGATTGRTREFACQRCKNKISRDLDVLSRVDFTERRDAIALDNGKARISCRFTCYPGHDDDSTGVTTDKEYIIRAVLKDELQVVIALYEIPNRFKIARRVNSPIGGTGPIREPGAVDLQEMPRNPIEAQRDVRPSGVLQDESGANETVNQHRPRDLRVSSEIYNTPPLGTGSFTMQRPLYVPYPTPFMGVVSNTPTMVGGYTIQGIVEPTQEAPPATFPPQLHGGMDRRYPHLTPAPVQNAGMTSTTRSIVPTIPSVLLSSATTLLPSTEGSSNGSDHVITGFSLQQGTTQELNPCAEYVVPCRGPMSGGVEVTIVGNNFPYTLPLSVYFNTKRALVTRKTRETIRCLVPCTSSPGTVDVRILVEPPESAPEIDCRMTKFTYEDERMTNLMMHVKYIASRRNPALWESILTSIQRAVEASLEQASNGLEPNTSEGLLSLDHGPFEEIAIQILSSYSTYYDWKEDVSCPNGYGQTLAHLAVTLGYIRLLEQLISWEIDLSVRDTTGATALHFAYLYDLPECVSLLTRSGTNQQIHDESGRQAYATTSGASFNEALDDSSDFTSERSASIIDREEIFDNLTPSGAPKLQNGMPTSAQIEDSDLVAKQILLKAVPAKATTLPTTDMTGPCDKGHINQALVDRPALERRVSRQRGTLNIAGEEIDGDVLPQELERLRLPEEEPDQQRAHTPNGAAVKEPAWKMQNRELLSSREVILTERSYLSQLTRFHSAMIGGHAASYCPDILFEYLPLLIQASQLFLSFMEEDPSTMGVSGAFISAADVLERTLVAYCAVAGEIFLECRKAGSSSNQGPGIGPWNNGSSSGHHASHNSPIMDKLGGQRRSFVTRRNSAGLIGRRKWRSLPSGAAAPAFGFGFGMSTSLSSVPPSRSSSNTQLYCSDPSSPVPPSSSSVNSGSTTTPTPVTGHSSFAASIFTQGKLRANVTASEVAVRPTQRVIRYVLLYRDLLASTPLTSTSRPLVQRALDCALRIATLCDEAQSHEALEKDKGRRATTVLPLSSDRDKGYIIQELEKVEAGIAIQSAGIASQGSSRQMLLPSGMPILTPQVSPSAPIPTISPERPTPTTPLTVVASPIQSPVSPPYNPPPNQTLSLAKKPVGSFLHSLLGANQIKPPDAHPTGLVHKAPKSPPLEPYEFREMTLGCRFVTTDQWLTTRVDTSWTVSQVKLHMLTKLLGARRNQLKALNRLGDSYTQLTSSSDPARIHEVKTISTSNRSSVIFAFQEYSDPNLLNYSSSPRRQPLARPVERQPFDAEPNIPSSFAQSAPTTYQAHLVSETDRQLPHRNFGAATAPPVMSYLNTSNLNKEDLLDELLDRLETDAREAVYKLTDKYCLIRFLGGAILDDRMALTECQIRPFELLEVQEKSRVLQIPRRVYLDAYWESTVEVRTQGGGEPQGIEYIKKFARLKREEMVERELQRAFVAEFMSNPVDEAHKGPRSAAASMLLPWKNTPEARARGHEKKRRKLLQKAEQEEMKRQKREIKEAAAERWKGRLAIVEGHQLSVWKDRADDHPEQSWDLRHAIEVSAPKRRKHSEFPPGSVATAYAALKKSNTLNVIRVKAKQKYNMEEGVKAKQPHYDLHIRFSIPLLPDNEAWDSAGVAAKVTTKLKRWLKRGNKTSDLRNSTSFAKLLPNSSGQSIQGVGVGTSVLESAGSATLVLRLPDEQSLENLFRVIHRAAGKYPLNQELGCPGVLSEGEGGQGVHDRGAVDAIAAKNQETKVYIYPEWRKRILQKCVASGRHGPLTSGWKARLTPNTWGCDLPWKMQKWWENEEEENGEEMLPEEDYEPVSMTSDAEWEGWRSELALKEPIGPCSPILKAAQEGNPWLSDRTLSPNRTDFYGRTRSY